MCFWHFATLSCPWLSDFLKKLNRGFLLPSVLPPKGKYYLRPSVTFRERKIKLNFYFGINKRYFIYYNRLQWKKSLTLHIQEKYIYIRSNTVENSIYTTLNWEKAQLYHFQICHFEMKKCTVLKALFIINKHYYGSGNKALSTLNKKNWLE